MILFNSAAMERENYHLNCLRSPHELNMSRYDTQIKYEDNFLGTSCFFVFVFVEKVKVCHGKVKLLFLTQSQLLI